jgi:hypothetical protein
MRYLFFAVTLAVLAFPVSAQADRLVRIAGGGTGGDKVPATEAKLIAPFGVDFDELGNMYIVELSGQRLLRVDAKGLFHVVAGAAEQKGHEGDGGPAAKARFNGMHSLAVGPQGDVFLADTWNNRIRKYEPKTGKIFPFAGTGAKGYSGDGYPAKDAQYGGLYCAAFNPQKTKLYLTDLDNRRIRAVNMADPHHAELIAGNGEKGVPKDGADAKTAPLVDPRAATVDRAGNVYILERGGHALRVVDAHGKIRTIAGTGKAGLSGDGGPAREAALNGPKHLCIDLEDNVIIADTANHVIRKYTPKDGRIVRLAGTGKKGASGDGGPALEITFNEPHGVCVHENGTLYIVDSNNHRVFRVEKE